MSSFPKSLGALTLLAVGAGGTGPNHGLPGRGPGGHAQGSEGLGHRRAPRLQGPARGQRIGRQGMEVWEGKCASCHGIFGESNEIFSPLVGGTTKPKT